MGEAGNLCKLVRTKNVIDEGWCISWNATTALEDLKDSDLIVPPALRRYLDLDGAVLDPIERDRNSTPSSL